MLYSKGVLWNGSRKKQHCRNSRPRQGDIREGLIRKPCITSSARSTLYSQYGSIYKRFQACFWHAWRKIWKQLSMLSPFKESRLKHPTTEYVHVPHGSLLWRLQDRRASTCRPLFEMQLANLQDNGAYLRKRVNSIEIPQWNWRTTLDGFPSSTLLPFG